MFVVQVFLLGEHSTLRVKEVLSSSMLQLSSFFCKVH